jgi:hypothetical protein
MGTRAPQKPPTDKTPPDARWYAGHNPPAPKDRLEPPAPPPPPPPRQAIPPSPLDSCAELWRFAMKLEDDLARLDRRVARLEVRRG